MVLCVFFIPWEERFVEFTCTGHLRKAILFRKVHLGETRNNFCIEGDGVSRHTKFTIIP